MHPGQDDDVPADPAVVPDGDRARVLDVIAPRLDLGLVRGGQDAHVGPKHDALPDADEGAVEDGGVEVEVAPRPDGGVAPVFHDEGRFDGDVGPDAPEDLGVHFRACLVQGVQVGGGVAGREPGVVPMAPGAGVVAGVF